MSLSLAPPDFLAAQHYQRIARTLEESKFHLAFFDDRLAMPDSLGDSYDETVRHGIRAVKMDLIPILTAMGMATSRLGLGGTCSTTYFEPFHVARAFATLDLMIGGRAAWNVVTSLNDSEAANFGHSQHLEHDLRYERADEFIEVVLGHWSSWADDALIVDQANRMFADPAKVRRLNHEGKWFRSRGPFTVPRSPQGHPVIMQAGQSGRGMAFAARWGELIFGSVKSPDAGRATYRALKDAVSDAGRDPGQVKLAPPIYAIVGETRSIAQEKRAFIESLAEPEDSLTLIAEVTNFDFSKVRLDEPLHDEQMAQVGINLGLKARVVERSGKSNPTPRDFIEFSKRGTINEAPVFCGAASDIADQLEDWFTSEVCDGFVLSATHRPGAYEDFGRLVVPELQRRGLFHTDYAGTTLRENLGLDRPVVR
ncbi:LLM class flavin-dependent oxidoreductase [Rhodopila sp.]|uniref:LLM class flavin-dependent oxidoreductase n=1 Tax=Rhodopila sp. TaxID=2480087 RepID=UPI003D0A3C62